ncbi:amidohydrolase family protein [Microbacterium sp. NIBRBAC000506063]|uniref:amidohydrolase family protein n=1 Tax=Microbacterium sp. NIBRBAC000506063 TaxID=2734618 RepID=UPI001BB5FB34|nr:amidohydrolase [Microbacterium sp. NIBRBAC000506063]QTV80432.1 amidohydrolase [Microbacterium sp. NIBRBAC000506063]
MSRTVIVNGAILTEDPANPFYSDGSIVIEGSRITWIGPASELVALPDDRVIDASRRIVAPGLVNLHYHVDLGKTAGEPEERAPMWEMLFQNWYPYIGSLSDEDAYWASLACYSESIKSGTTTVNDMYVQTPARARAAREVGMRAVLSNEIATPETGIDTVADNIRAFHDVARDEDGLVRVAMGVEWLPCASPELLTEVREAASELGMLIHIHLNESMSEVEDALSRFGKRPTQLAYELGFLGTDVIAAHAVQLDDSEIGMIAETGTHISHNPASNSLLANGIARLNDYRHAGINVGLGSDAGLGFDLFEVMRWATFLHRATVQDITATRNKTALTMATRNGAAALGLDAGVLAPGKRADLVLVDVDQVKYALLDRTNHAMVLDYFVLGTSGADVDTSIINGEVVMSGRRLTKVDENEVALEAASALKRAQRRFAMSRH